MKQACYHCNLPVSDRNRVRTRIKNHDRDFCCHGCASVCQTIHEAGLGGFYQQQTSSVLPAVDLEYPLEFYDSEVFQAPFLEASKKGEKAITLISDTIHCAACIWLIERALGQMEGVLMVRANLTDKRIRIRWDEKKVRLSSIMQRLADLGYAAMPYEANMAEVQAKKHNKQMLYRISFAAFTMMNLLWVSIAMYTGASGGKYQNYFEWIGFSLATPTLFYAGYPFLKNAYTGIKNGFMNMDVPISIGALTTYFYSLYVLLGLTDVGEVYFDTVVNFIFIILIGRYLESSGKKSALSASTSLQQLQPKVALVKTKNQELIKPIANIELGDIVIIKPGERIAVDGVIDSGESEVDESLLSGESIPITKRVGDSVFAGTLNTIGNIEVKVVALMRQSTLSQIVDLVEDTKASRSKIVCTIDKVIPYFVWTTLALATLTFVYWYPQNFDLALLSATSVLIITCPCAFGLATPMSIAVASGVAAKRKIMIKDPDALETLSQIDQVVFDKTGTLTMGAFRVNKIVSSIDRQDFLQLIASIEKKSEHLLAKAIVSHAKGLELSEAKDFMATPGGGVSARIDNAQYWVGNLDFLPTKTLNSNDALLASSAKLEQQGNSCIWCANDEQILGFIALSDQIKTDAKAVVERLKKMGKQVTLLSGDSKVVSSAVAEQLSIDNVIAGVLPQDKVTHIKALQKTGKVLMVGDGINDAPALMQADASIAIGSGSDISVQSANLVLLKSTLSPVIEAIELSKRTQRTIKQNIVFALSYNMVMVPLAMMAKVTPLFAAIVMPISSLIVIGNSARLKRLAKQLKN